MPRSSRVVIEGCAHHVTQRGNNRQDVFFVDDDRRVFLALLAEAAEHFDLAVEQCCGTLWPGRYVGASRLVRLAEADGCGSLA